MARVRRELESARRSRAARRCWDAPARRAEHGEQTERYDAAEHEQRIRSGAAERRRGLVARAEPREDVAHACLLGGSEAREVFAPEIAVEPAVPLERLAPFARPHHGRHGIIERAPLLAGETRRR